MSWLVRGIPVWALLLPLLVSSAAGQMPQYAAGELFSRVGDGVVQVAVSIDIDDDWYLYHETLGDDPEAIGQVTSLELAGEGITWSAVRFPEPTLKEQYGLGSKVLTHKKTLVLYALGELGDGATGEDVTGVVAGLTCSDIDGTCVPYNEDLSSDGAGPDALFAAFPDDLDVGDDPGANTRPVPEASGTAPVARADIDYADVEFPAFQPQVEEQTRGFGAWLLLAFIAGMILNVMPCVLPVISIKILSFVQQAGEDRKRILHLGLAFAAGIVVVFVVLAFLAVNLQLSWGEQFQSQGFLITMIGVVFAFSLSMFGVYELGVPAGVGQLAAGPPREGLGDAFFKGMLATVLATPCSGPFLGSTLTWTLSQPATVIFAVFLSLGLGMAAPYVVLTANPKLLKVVPKPGPWMDTFKHAMGFVLLITVVYLMISLRQDMLLFTIAFLVTVAFGCWWWGRFSLRARSKGRRWLTLATALLLIALGARVSFVEFRGIFLVADDEHGWVDFEPDVFQAALDDGRSVFVDFTANWCPNCKANEKLVYDSEAVRAALESKGVLMLKADITQDNPKTDMIERLMAGLGARSIPFMAVFGSDRPKEPQVRFDLVGKEDFLGIVTSLPDP